MGVPVPPEAVRGILEEQREWEKKRNGNKDHRTTFVYMVNSTHFVFAVLHRNQQKQVKKIRHKREKQYTEVLYR